MSLDVVPSGTFSACSSDPVSQVRQLVSLGKVEIAQGLNLAQSADQSVVWAAIRPHIDRVITVDMYNYKINAFVMKHELCIDGCAEEWPAYGNMMKAMKYWVFNSAAPNVENPSIALSDETEEQFLSLPVLHEAFENAIALEGVRIDGELVPKSGSCVIASKLEIAEALNMFSTAEVVQHLRTREHMFANAGEGIEFQGSLDLIRTVLEILDPS
jgi:hypothetical protein